MNRALKGILALSALLLVPACGGGGDTTVVQQGGGSAPPAPASAPVITSIFPAEAKAGEYVFISGSNFGSAQVTAAGTATLDLNGVLMPPLSWGDTLIYAAVPSGAGTGVVTVTVGGAGGTPGFLIVPWNVESPINVPVTTASGAQTTHDIVSDCAGGAIIAWEDYRSGTGDIYAQRIDRTGTPQWTADGVVVCAATGAQAYVRLVSDGAGGAILAWADARGGTDDVYAQRLNASGAAQWTADGVPLCAAVNAQNFPQVVPDGSGGALVVWQDLRNGVTLDVYAQRVNGAGVVQWTVDGVPVTAAGDQLNPKATPDGSGGAVVVWDDYRSGTNSDVYAQRINGSGTALWTAGGVVVSAAAFDQKGAELTGDGGGGAIFVWRDDRSNSTVDIYAQRVNGAGTAQWTADGIPINTLIGDQVLPHIAGDGAGGAILAWQDNRNLGNRDIFVQRLSAAGAALWAGGGAPLCIATGDQLAPRLISDGAGGAVVTWQDFRGAASDIYAQRVNSAGVSQWTPEGIAISEASGAQLPPTLATDGSGGAIISWFDFRRYDFDIYAQGVTAGGRQ